MAAVVSENEAAERYEIHVDGEPAGFLEYRGRGDTRALIHTEIDERHEGGGLGSELIRSALDDLRARGLHVVPMCPFVKHFLAEHDDYLDLVEPNIRAAFGLQYEHDRT